MQRRRSPDEGPVLRLLGQPESRKRYDAIWVLTTVTGEGPAKSLAAELPEHVSSVELVPLDIPDPSDHAALFEALGPVVDRIPVGAEVDVLLSAGTPQAQTLWVILVKAGLLDARMLQVIPPAFVPHPHPRAIRVVDMDIDGFPEIRSLREELVRLRAEVRSLGGGLVGDSQPMRQLHRRLMRVAPSRLPVLILGETGTGKELVARAVHDASPRAQGPFIAENCAALDEGVLGSALFGHERGAFTGATTVKRGLFELAHGGTLLLDEVGELPHRVQVSLLRVLQEGRFRRVGGERSIDVDVRVVAATHRDLPELIKAGSFREDLYYRLKSATLNVPPLRERGADLEQLLAHFAKEQGVPMPALSRSAWSCLRAWNWPGNVRELRAEVFRWFVLCEGEVQVEDLSPEIQAGSGQEVPVRDASSGPAARLTMEHAVSVAEVAVIQDALAATRGNLSAAARELAIDRNTLKRKMKRHGLERV